jgi:hypothetical protein
MVAQVKAGPPSHPLLASGLFKGLLSLLHVWTGELTGAFPDQEHEGLQQSQ